MKIVKILVDEVPENCWDCPYYNIIYCGRMRNTYCYGIPSLDYKVEDGEKARPLWCPLEKEV